MADLDCIDDPARIQELVESWLPYPEERQEVLTGLAESVEEVHRVTPRCWGLSVVPKRKHISLNVGMVNVVVLSTGPDQVVVADNRLLPPGVHGTTEPGHYKNAPHGVPVDVPSKAFRGFYERLREAHRATIEEAGRRKSGYLWPERHSAGLIGYLSKVVGRELPNPDYLAEVRAATSQSSGVKTWLLTWNPKKWLWDTLDEELQRSRRGESVAGRWSCGNTNSIQPGDRVFLHKQGQEPRGIIASGWVTSLPYEDEHWDPEHDDQPGLYVSYEFDHIRTPDAGGPLQVREVDAGPLTDMWWDAQASGTEIPLHVAHALEGQWAAHIGRLRPPAPHPYAAADEELAAFEGELRPRFVMHRSRERKLRDQKIEQTLKAQGRLVCEVPGCGFDFERVYGREGVGYAHVHHKVSLSSRKTAGLTRLEDLSVLCANCHAIIHRGGECRDMDSLIPKP